MGGRRGLLGEDSIEDFIIRVSSDLDIPLHNMVVFTKLAKDYLKLQKKDFLDLNDLQRLLYAVTGINARITYIRSIVASLNTQDSTIDRQICEEIRNMLERLGLHPGKTYKFIKNNKNKELYLKLEILNIIYIDRKYNKIFVKNNKKIQRICSDLARRGYLSIDEAIRYSNVRSRDDFLRRIESGLPISTQALSSLSRRELLSLGESLLSRRLKRHARIIGEALISRIMSGEDPVDADREIHFLRRLGMLDRKILFEYAKRGYVSPDITLHELLPFISELNREEASTLVAEVVSRSRDVRDIRELLSKVPLDLLYKVRPPKHLRGEERDLLRAAVYAAKALSEAIEFAEKLNPGRADLALDYSRRAMKILEGISTKGGGPLNKRKISSLARAAEFIVGFVENPSLPSYMRGFTSFLSDLSPEDSLSILRKLYHNSHNYKFKNNIIDIALNLLERYATLHGLSTLSSKNRTRARRGRLLVRDSLYNIIRYNTNPIIYVEKKRAKPVSVLVDVSGSMRRHAEWSFIAASLFYRNVNVLGVFSTQVTFLRRPFTRREFGEFLLSVSFGGRTDIALALKRILNNIYNKNKIIVITDLAHNSGEPLEGTVRKLVQAGHRVLFVVPREHDAEMASRVVEAGARVIVTSSPVRTARTILSEALR